MINSIVQVFKEQAKQHKSIRAFYYNRKYELGNGNETHPLFWLEDPFSGRNQNNLFVNSVNFSILLIPEREKEIMELQNLAFSIGLNIIERIRQNKNSRINILPTWSYLTLRDYYDNNACGCRFSVSFTHVNMQDLCLIEEQFDTAKIFGKENVLPDFDIDKSGTEIFTGKLPVFDLKIRKHE